jgi:hypothetical protein
VLIQPDIYSANERRMPTRLTTVPRSDIAIQRGREIDREVFTGVADYRLKQEHIDAQLKKFWEHRIDSN